MEARPTKEKTESVDEKGKKTTYILNPLAPEFVPRARRKREAYLQKMMSNLQAEALRQPNAYAALMQVVILTYSNSGTAAAGQKI